MTPADDGLEHFFSMFYREMKDMIFHVNPLQRIHMKHPALFSSKSKK